MSHGRKQTLSLQHVFAGERLQAFSDAVFSIIVTFMVSSYDDHPLAEQLLHHLAQLFFTLGDTTKTTKRQKSIQGTLVASTVASLRLIYVSH